jgi:hypothetical protein
MSGKIDRRNQMAINKRTYRHVRTYRYALVTGLLLLAALLVLGCPKPRQTPEQNLSGLVNTESTQSSTSGGAGPTSHGPVDSTQTSTGDGGRQIVTSATGSVPPSWPAYVPIMEGYSVNLGQTNAQGWMSVLASGPVNIDEATSYYMSLEGWEKDPTMPWVTEGTHRLLKLVRGRENLTININFNETKNVTELSLALFPKN